MVHISRLIQINHKKKKDKRGKKKIKIFGRFFTFNMFHSVLFLNKFNEHNDLIKPLS